MKEVYLVTGAGGYLGRAAVEALLHRGCRVRALVHSPQGAANLPAGAEAVPGSVLEPASLQALFSVPGEPPLCCIHAAGLISVNRRDPQVRLVNVEGTKNILELCQARMARLVYVSSVDALCLPERNEPVREPQRFFPEKLSTEYGRSKAESANMVLEAAKGGALRFRCAAQLHTGPRRCPQRLYQHNAASLSAGYPACKHYRRI